MKTITVYALRENKAPVGFAPWEPSSPAAPPNPFGVSDMESLRVGFEMGVAVGLAARRPKKRKRKR